MATQPLCIDYLTGHCSLGGLLLGACELGICSILLGDDDESLLRDLQSRFPGARLQANPERLRPDIQQLLAFIERPQQPLSLSPRRVGSRHCFTTYSHTSVKCSGFGDSFKVQKPRDSRCR